MRNPPDFVGNTRPPDFLVVGTVTGGGGVVLVEMVASEVAGVRGL